MQSVSRAGPEERLVRRSGTPPIWDDKFTAAATVAPSANNGNMACIKTFWRLHGNIHSKKALADMNRCPRSRSGKVAAAMSLWGGTLTGSQQQMRANWKKLKIFRFFSFSNLVPKLTCVGALFISFSWPSYPEICEWSWTKPLLGWEWPHVSTRQNSEDGNDFT